MTSVGLGSGLLSRSEIVRVRARAVRRGLWYRVLTRAERACVDLTVKVVDVVRSRVLWSLVFSVLKKLEDAGESRLARLMRGVGVEMADRLGSVAQGWGNVSAASWKMDSGFIRFLAVLHMNAST